VVGENDFLARKAHSEIRLGCDHHAEGLELAGNFNFAFLAINRELSEVDGTAFGRNRSENGGKILGAEFLRSVQAIELRVNLHDPIPARNLCLTPVLGIGCADEADPR